MGNAFVAKGYVHAPCVGNGERESSDCDGRVRFVQREDRGADGCLSNVSPWRAVRENKGDLRACRWLRTAGAEGLTAKRAIR